MKKRRPDWFLLLCFILLIAFGWVNVFSTVYDGTFTWRSSYGMQLIWIGAVALIGMFTYVTSHRLFYNIAVYVYLTSILLIILVLLFGVTRSGAKSWLGVGGFGIQPAEFAKYGVCLLLSYFMSQLRFDAKQPKDIISAGFIIGLPFGLMLLQNDTGTALPLLFLIFPLFREGLPKWILFAIVEVFGLFIASMFMPKWLLILLICITAIIFIIIRIKRHRRFFSLVLVMGLSIGYVLCVDMVYHKVLRPHQKQRIDLLFGKIDDVKKIGYNVNQAKIALGSGGLTGKGFGQGTQTHLNFVPEQSTDFIFCTIGEEYGFLGTIAVILMFLGFILRILYLSEQATHSFVRCYGYSIAAIFFAHFVINVGMTIGLMPVIGIPLPFISYGGSALWAFTFMLFTFINLESKMEGWR